MSELSLDRLRQLYALYQGADPAADWRGQYQAEVERLRALSDEALRTPVEQTALWRARGVAGLGPGEGVSVQGAEADPEVVEALAGLRSRRWPDDPGRRARAVQDAYDHLLDLVHPRHASQRPQAKLARAFAALLPADTTPCFNWRSQRDVAHLLLGSRRVGSLEGGVLARARLRAALGPEADVAEHVRRATFCWWLHENAATLAAGGNPSMTAPPPAPEPEPPLTLWSATRQRKGLPLVTGYVDTWRAVVAAAQEGASAEDIVDTLVSDLSGVSPRYGRRLFNQVRRLGFLEHDGGLWSPSAEGEELIEADPPDVLVDKLLVQTFGLAHTLRLLGEGPLRRGEHAARLRQLYPAWTSDLVPSAVLGWARALGLTESTPDRRHRLTGYGKAWADRLPAELPVPDHREGTPDGDEADDEPTPLPTAWPSLAQVLAAFAAEPALQRFVFDEADVRALHLAWHCHDTRRLVILSGLSGTGKTALLVHYTRIYLGLVGASVDDHRAIVAVSPDWRDPSGLLGYLNALHADPTFQAEPALRLVLRAVRNPTLPCFLLLDEMNLARVERYFAPFLSAMETGADLELHAHDAPLNDVPPRVRWPRNLFIGGTVNMDETTHPFSDKVLDRAFTLEFFEVDLDRYLARRAATAGARPDVEPLLKAINAALRPVRRHFGYRTAGEVLDFLDAAGEVDADTRRALLDQAIFSKVLPRLRGEASPALQRALDQVAALCRERGLRRSLGKLNAMGELLESAGVTRFWS